MMKCTPFRKLVSFVTIAIVWTSAARFASAQLSATLDVDVSKPGVAIPPSFGGLMTEEINHSYDGGLYAELIQNRSFQDPQPQGRGNRRGGNTEERPPVHWSLVGRGKISLDRENPVNAALPVSLKLELSGEEGGIANDGYWGIPVRPDTTYTARFYAKSSGGFSSPITASLRLDDGDTVVAKAATQSITGRWRKYTLTLKTGSDVKTTAKANFAMTAGGRGTVWFSYVSLFPPTYKNEPNGLRPDIMKLLADMKPEVPPFPRRQLRRRRLFRRTLRLEAHDWSVGAAPGSSGCWGYWSSDGFGFPEFLGW